MTNRPTWREHFSQNAGDLLALQAAFLGTDWLKDALLRCFRRSRADKINERTVMAVLDELSEPDFKELPLSEKDEEAYPPPPKPFEPADEDR